MMSEIACVGNLDYVCMRFSSFGVVGYCVYVSEFTTNFLFCLSSSTGACRVTGYTRLWRTARVRTSTTHLLIASERSRSTSKTRKMSSSSSRSQTESRSRSRTAVKVKVKDKVNTKGRDKDSAEGSHNSYKEHEKRNEAGAGKGRPRGNVSFFYVLGNKLSGRTRRKTRKRHRRP